MGLTMRADFDLEMRVSGGDHAATYTFAAGEPIQDAIVRLARRVEEGHGHVVATLSATSSSAWQERAERAEAKLREQEEEAVESWVARPTPAEEAAVVGAALAATAGDYEPNSVTPSWQKRAEKATALSLRLVANIGVSAIRTLIEERPPESTFGYCELFLCAQRGIRRVYGEVVYVNDDGTMTGNDDLANDAVLLATEGTKHAQDVEPRQYRVLGKDDEPPVRHELSAAADAFRRAGYGSEDVRRATAAFNELLDRIGD